MPTTETIMETKNCKICNTKFSITDKDLEFYKTISPSFNGEKFDIPSPTCCPKCRQRRRLAFRNERKLYTRKCDATGKNIISIYSPKYTGKVYDKKFWRSDKWDALEYWRDFDFNKAFFGQFQELMQVVPRMALHVIKNENCPYISFWGYNKSSYMIYTTDQSEKCFYGSYGMKNTACMDFLHTNSSEHCYEVSHCNNCYNCQFCIDAQNCSNCSYSCNLIGCQNCFLCNGLDNVQYYIRNKKYSKDEYLQEVKKITKKEAEQAFKIMVGDKYVPMNIWCTECEGKYLINSKECIACENTTAWDRLKYCSFTYQMRDSMDWDFYGVDAELWYECVNTAHNCYKIICLMDCWVSSSEMLYCNLCMNCKNCFACVWLKDQEYCIFNKQYTKEEYNTLVPRIIKKMQEDGEWGEFFDPSLSPFWYNETVATEYYPLNKEDAIALGFNWSDYEAPFPKVDKIVEGSKLWTASCDIINQQKPELLEKILNYAIKCEVSGKLFRLVKQEIEFYIKHKLPLPRKHPDIRHQERLELRK